LTVDAEGVVVPVFVVPGVEVPEVSVVVVPVPDAIF
jgi:hypothetical protein